LRRFKLFYSGTKEKCEKKCAKYIRRQSRQVSSTEDEAAAQTQAPISSRQNNLKGKIFLIFGRPKALDLIGIF
jgi:hypothetical protein